MPDTRAYRVSGSYDLFPQHCLLPELTDVEHATAVHDELVESIAALPTGTKKKMLRRLATTLQQIARGEQPIQRVADVARQQRVAESPLVTTTTNPTAPRTLQQTPRVHGRRTRNNTPRATPAIVHETRPKRRSPRLNPGGENENETGRARAITHRAPNSTRVPMFRAPAFISQEALSLLTEKAIHPSNPTTWTPRMFLSSSPSQIGLNQYDTDIEHFCGPVVHPTTGETITSYHKLARDPETNKTWTRAFGKEFGNLAQGDDFTGEKGTNAIFVLNHEQIRNIPKDRVVTYARVVVDYRPQKEDPNRVRITAGGNLLKYPGEDFTTRTADLTTAKILWNSVISTKNARFMGIDIKNFYLGTPLERYEYMAMPISMFPQHTKDQYELEKYAKKGMVYLEIRKAIYGLPAAGILANKLLRKRLAPHGYYEVPHTPGLWRHLTRPVQFSLVVDDFGVKYVGRTHAQHLIKTLQKWYKLAVDWKGDLYCGIQLDWNYDEGYVDISMPRYVAKILQRFKHKKPSRPQHSPYKAPPKKYGKDAQDPIPDDKSPKVDAKRIKRIQQVIGGVLYYARAVDSTVLVALSAIASEQTRATEQTELRIKQLLDYLATHPSATVRYRRSNMVLNIHSDASYLSETRARSRIAGHYFLGSKPIDDKPIPLNGAIYAFCGILKFVVASAAEAELGALFLNCKEGKVVRLILEELGHAQPPTPVHCDNKTAAGIANNSVKKQQSRSMEMRFFWVADQCKMQNFDIQWHPGQENLADYFTKHFHGKHHQEVRPWYLHMPHSPRSLPRAAAPSVLRGCAGTLPHGYIRSAPLPRVAVAAHVTGWVPYGSIGPVPTWPAHCEPHVGTMPIPMWQRILRTSHHLKQVPLRPLPRAMGHTAAAA